MLIPSYHSSCNVLIAKLKDCTNGLFFALPRGLYLNWRRVSPCTECWGSGSSCGLEAYCNYLEKGLFFAFVLCVIFCCGIRSNRIWNSMVVWDCLLSICTVWSCVIGFDSLCTYCTASLEQLGLGCCIWESHLSWACFPFPGTGTGTVKSCDFNWMASH